MAAYAAVISLKHTIHGLLNSCRISLVTSTRVILESAYTEVTSLQHVLERSNDSSSSRSRRSHERLDGLEGQIRDCAHKLEDVLEFHELNSDEEVMRQEITCFGEAVKKMETDYIQELSRDGDGDDDAALSRINDFGVEMVGQLARFAILKSNILRRMRPDELVFVALWGKEGFGRTVGAKAMFDDARMGRCAHIFDSWAWVRVGPKHELKEILIRIIAQVDNLAAEADYEFLISQEDAKISKYLYKLLEKQRYMIMLDDVDDVKLVNHLKTTAFPDQSNGSVVFLTTTSVEIARSACYVQNWELPPRYIEEYMWEVICKVIIRIESISEEMKVAINMIIHNCGSQFITAFKTFLFLLKSDKTVEEWSKLAADEQNPIFRVEDELSEMHQIKMEMQHNNSGIKEVISGVIKFNHEEIRTDLYPKRFFSRMRIISVYGMAGIGKTTFFRKISKDEAIVSHFDHHVWITLGQYYQTEKILLDILAQIYPNTHVKVGDEKLVKNLCERLSSKRCLIVLDDLWSKEPLLHLKKLFPDIKGTTMVTTRFPKVAAFENDDFHFKMQLLDKEESWCLLQQKVFGGGLCSPELEKAGRKIAEKCDGLPLLILTVAQELLKVDMSQDTWNNVASGKEKLVFKNAHHQISEALLPSFQSLPQHLKPCFLYMGVFREKIVISTSKLTQLWISEGFLEPNQMKEDFVEECLFNLFDRSLLMLQQTVSPDQFETCRLHSVFWHLSNSQAEKSKFFHAMNSYADCSVESMQSQRRLCIRNSILLSMKYVQNSMESSTSAHSLLCVNSLHQYPLPLNLELRLLRVMNALTIRLYEFPIEVVRLVHLRYLGLTCNGKLPASISNLWKLQCLIVKRYMNINTNENSSSHLPVEIWEMKELKHLQIMGGCLPNHRDGAGLPKLSTLLDVSAESCRDEVLKWIPNLKRLGVLIELAPNDDEGNYNSFRCLNNIYLLDKLESLKCVVVNPQIRSEFVPPPPLSMFPASLRKLSLSGLGYPWEHMSIISELENLEELRLQCYAFRGPKWETCSRILFKKLKFLLVEDTDLVHWKFGWDTASNLDTICIKHCYKVKELPIALCRNGLARITIVDCNPLIMSWVEEIRLIQNRCLIEVDNSWYANTRQE